MKRRLTDHWATNSGAQASASSNSGVSSSDSSSPGSSSDNSSSGSSSDAGGNSNSPGSPSSSGFSGPVFGGGPILGVASLSKAKSIRVFYQKNHYNDWLFIYVPGADRGGLLVGPVNPGVQTGITGIGGLTPGQAGGLMGQGQGFGVNAGTSLNSPTPTQQNPGQTAPQQ